jgi:hypothetical protein
MTALALRGRTYDDRQWPVQIVVPSHFSQSVSEPVGYQRPEVSVPSTNAQPKWVEPTVARMHELVPLQFNWDRRGSAEVSVDALHFALNILGQVMPASAPAPSIVPLGHGGIQLLWHNANADLEVEVVRPNEVVAYFLNKRTGHEHEIPLTTDFSAITNFLWDNFRS